MTWTFSIHFGIFPHPTGSVGLEASMAGGQKTEAAKEILKDFVRACFPLWRWSWLSMEVGRQQTQNRKNANKLFAFQNFVKTNFVLD